MESRLSLFVTALIVLAAILLFGEALAKNKPPSARTIDPIVSTDWLEQNLEADLVIIDIRDPVAYATGHIPGSINEPFVTGFDPVSGPFSNWIAGSADGLWLEIPPVADLFDTIGNLGITEHSRVVIVTAPNPDPEAEPPFYGLANGTRVAFTLIYAGVKNVAILDGGYPKWITEGKEIETEAPDVEAIPYRNRVNKEILASRQEVKKSLKKADIVDARDAEVYFGATIEPFANKAGHIPGAKCLPAPWIWAVDSSKTYYTYKDAETLGAMASGVLREPYGYKGHKDQDIIVYCGVGGYESSWWFVLTQVLSYQNVKFYDGAAQEWVRYYDMVPYQWE